MPHTLLNKAGQVVQLAKTLAEVQRTSVADQLRSIVADPHGGCELATAAALLEAEIIPPQVIHERLTRELTDVLLVLHGAKLKCAMLAILAEKIGVKLDLPDVQVPGATAPDGERWN